MPLISQMFSHLHNRHKRNNRAAKRFETARLGLEALESRILLASDPITTLQFNIPPETANLGVQAGLYSNTNHVYLDPTTQSFQPLSNDSPKLPLWQFASTGQSYTDPVEYNLQIPSGQDVKSGELFLFVGDVHTGLAITTSKTTGIQVSAPSAAPSPASATTPDNYAQFEFNYQLEGSGTGLDIDISAVDSTGFPFTLVYPSSANLAFPLNPLGITIDQTDLNTNFQDAFDTGGQYSAYPEFSQCATFVAQQDPQSMQVVAPQDILSQEKNPPQPVIATAKDDPASQLLAGENYWYCITAYSDHVIDNSGGLHGETLLSDPARPVTLSGQQSVELSWEQYYDPNTAGYNIFRYSTTDDKYTPTDSDEFTFIGQVTGATTTTYVDQGLSSPGRKISGDTDSVYGFNPLSDYYTQEILNFFDHYKDPDSFVIRRDQVRWIGNTVSYAPKADWNQDGHVYTMLELTAQNDAGSIKSGDTVHIYQPIFSSNTRYVSSDAPPMPSWMSAGGTDIGESPSQMVFGCDGVFASNRYDPDITAGAKVPLADIENSIVSAFNRGIANDYSIQPDNWASFPKMLGYPTITQDAGSKVATTTTYYYVVTAVNVYGETTPSLEVAATLETGEVATLNWANGDNAPTATEYRIYRGTSPDSLTLLHTTSNGQQTYYTDKGEAASSTNLPHEYFAAGTISNWYAAMVQTNSLLDPQAGASINGLSYGFPYSDQGGVSTNIDFALTDIPETITVNLGSLKSPSFVTQSLPDAVVNADYRQPILAGGSGSNKTFSISGGSPPSWLALDANTGVLSNNTSVTPSATPYEFIVTITDTVGSTSMPFQLNVVDQEPTAPLTVSGLSNGVLTLPDADVNLQYSTNIEVSGATGPYTLQTATADPLPAGIDLGFTNGTKTSANGTFALSGTQPNVTSAVGFNAIASDSSVAMATPIIGISAKSVTVASPGTGYQVGDTFDVAGGGGTGAEIQVATVDGSGGITSIEVTISGSGFTTPPTSFTPKSVNGSNAQFAPGVGDQFRIAGFTLTNPGSNYLTAPTVTIRGGGTTDQTITATLGNGAQTGQVVDFDLTPLQDVGYTPQAGVTIVYIDPPSLSDQCHFTISLQVNPTLQITTLSLPSAALNHSYCQTITTNQDSDNITYAVSSGSLPNGLQLKPWGVLCGTPTNAGNYTFEIEATDAAGGTSSHQYQNFEVTTTAPDALAITTTKLSPFVPGKAYSQAITSNVVVPDTVTFSIVHGAFPDGLTFSSNGNISGSPVANANQAATFTVRARDRLGNTAHQGYNLNLLKIDSNSNPIAIDANTLVINGSGFNPTPANNRVTLPGSGAKEIRVTAATSNRLTIKFNGPLNVGALHAAVTVDGVASHSQQVAYVASNPVPRPGPGPTPRPSIPFQPDAAHFRQYTPHFNYLVDHVMRSVKTPAADPFMTIQESILHTMAVDSLRYADGLSGSGGGPRSRLQKPTIAKHNENPKELLTNAMEESGFLQQSDDAGMHQTIQSQNKAGSKPDQEGESGIETSKKDQSQGKGAKTLRDGPASDGEPDANTPSDKPQQTAPQSETSFNDSYNGATASARTIPVERSEPT